MLISTSESSPTRAKAVYHWPKPCSKLRKAWFQAYFPRLPVVSSPLRILFPKKRVKADSVRV
ncbi:hypothetical protein BDV32DRAFT_121819 [Aspergillus pseudonomiae]|nr:hypothetical protein BDV32DRAFT_121819 [Aspergillus pseudonomiae]